MTSNLTHIDLFSGIGGFALASSWAGFETIVFCEKDKFCHKILNKHWPDVPIIEDIHEFDGKQFSGATLLTGGVPCQPASTAGKRRGTEDDRWLWPETFRIIREAKPTWTILENVRGLLALEQGMVFDNLLYEVEALGYETRSFVIPACGVNAPHKRERVWVVAHARHIWLQERGFDVNANDSFNQQGRVCGDDIQIEQSSTRKTMANSDIKGLQGHWQHGECSRELPFGAGRPKADTRPNWEFEPNVGRVANGVPNRVDRLRSLGNAIVPQVAYQIIKGIAETETQQSQHKEPKCHN